MISYFIQVKIYGSCFGEVFYERIFLCSIFFATDLVNTKQRAEKLASCGPDAAVTHACRSVGVAPVLGAPHLARIQTKASARREQLLLLVRLNVRAADTTTSQQPQQQLFQLQRLPSAVLAPQLLLTPVIAHLDFRASERHRRFVSIRPQIDRSARTQPSTTAFLSHISLQLFSRSKLRELLLFSTVCVRSDLRRHLRSTLVHLLDICQLPFRVLSCSLEYRAFRLGCRVQVS